MPDQVKLAMVLLFHACLVPLFHCVQCHPVHIRVFLFFVGRTAARVQICSSSDATTRHHEHGFHLLWVYLVNIDSSSLVMPSHGATRVTWSIQLAIHRFSGFPVFRPVTGPWHIWRFFISHTLQSNRTSPPASFMNHKQLARYGRGEHCDNCIQQHLTLSPLRHVGMYHQTRPLRWRVPTMQSLAQNSRISPAAPKQAIFR
jgi:hypothetical protein